MSFWYDRFKIIRKHHKLSQAKLGRTIGKDGTQISRYERGSLKDFPDALHRLLKDIFTKEEIEYIENGEIKPDISQDGKANNQIVGNGNSIGSCIKKANGVIAECLAPDILSVVEMMQEMDKTKRRKVLRFVLDIEEE